MTTSPRSTLTIERIGSDGDGLARTADGGLVVVPFALPGDVIVDGVLTSRSEGHRTAPCRHFMQCGGCVAQHMRDTVYAAWKRDLVVDALKQHKIGTEVAPLVCVSPGTRRRATFSSVRTADGIRLGFHRRRDSSVLPVEACPVVTARIERALPHLARMVSRLGGVTGETRVAVADLDGGLDVLVTGVAAIADAGRRAALAKDAVEMNLARLTIDNETIVVRASVGLSGASGMLRPEPGGFFQAVGAAEGAIVDEVLGGVPRKPKRIADLFSGIGTLTIPLARRAPVSAFDSDNTLLAALETAVRHTSGVKPVVARFRDLVGEPLSRKELEAFDTVVLDPPRGGAKAQCESLARSTVETVIMVSCNPQTLARDLRLLIDGGYTLARVVPIDQFLWSAHVEVVAVLRREQKRKSKSA